MAGNIRKVVAGDRVLLDLTNDTVTADSMLKGVVAHDSNGDSITGSIETKTSANMTVNGNTVTAPAGYYASNQSKSVADGSYSASVVSHSITTTPAVTPSIAGSIQNISSLDKPAGTDGVDFYTIDPSGSVTTTGVSSTKAKATIGTAGYISAGDAESAVDTVNITPTIHGGTNRYLKKGSVEVSGNASATITGLNYTYNSENQNFDVTGNGAISGTATAEVTAGYIPTGDTGSITGTANLTGNTAKIALKATKSSGTALQTPEIAKQAISITNVTDAANGNASTTAPTSGVYVAVKSAKKSSNVVVKAQVQSAGYGTTTDYTEGSVTTESGANASAVTYVPVKSASSADADIKADYGTASTSGTTKDYIDVSVDIPEGYQTAHTISKRFENILPDVDTDITVEYILAGYTGYDDHGNKIVGSMTNQGSKTQTLNPSTTSYTIPKGYHDGTGKVSITTQTKSATPTKSSQTISPDSGKVLSSVTVNPIPAAYITTTDATATAAQIKKGQTAYVNGSKITGTAEITLVDGVLTIPDEFVTFLTA